MTDFEHTMERRGGGEMTVSVKADTITFTIFPPITANEREVADGLASLGKALQREVSGSAGDGSISIQTNGHDLALAKVAVSSLSEILQTGEPERFASALHRESQPLVAQQPQKEESAIQGLSEVQKAAAAIGNAMKNMVTASKPELAVAAQSIPGKSEGRGIV